MRALSTVVNSLTVTRFLTSMYFYFTAARICYQRMKLSEDERKMREHREGDMEDSTSPIHPQGKELAWRSHVLCL